MTSASSDPGGDRPKSERRVLYLTTNDVADPSRGCDRRSRQLGRWLGHWNRVYAISYSKTDGAAGGHSNTDGATGGSSVPDRSMAYPRSKVLAPINPAFFREILALRSHRDFDWVVASGLGSVLYGVFAALVFGSRFVVDLHNAERVLSKDLGDLPHYLFAVSVGELAIRLADLVAFTSAHDRAHYSERVRRKSVIVSNGFDSELFFPSESDGGEYLLFFGNMEYPPNREAVGYIAREVAPKVAESAHDAEILIAGPHCEEIRDRIDRELPMAVLGRVDDIADRIRDARMVIVPLRTGSGTRLKIIESLACATPILSTPKGAEGWSDEWRNLRIAEQDEFSESVVSALDSRFAFDRDELSAYDGYSWREQVEKLDREMDAVDEP